MNCRVFEYEGNQYEVPSKEMLIERIRKVAFESEEDCFVEEYILPQNLKKFFDGKEEKNQKKGSACN